MILFNIYDISLYMIYDDISWCVIMYDDIWWHVMIHHAKDAMSLRVTWTGFCWSKFHLPTLRFPECRVDSGVWVLGSCFPFDNSSYILKQVLGWEWRMIWINSFGSPVKEKQPKGSFFLKLCSQHQVQATHWIHIFFLKFHPSRSTQIIATSHDLTQKG